MTEQRRRYLCAFALAGGLGLAGCHHAQTEKDPTPEAAQPLRPLRAEIVEPDEITVHLARADQSLAPYRLTDAAGTPIGFAVKATDGTTVTLAPDAPLDQHRVHYLTSTKDDHRVRVRFDGWFRDLYTDRPLGALVDPSGTYTEFAIFAPRADAVTLFLYERPDDKPDEAVAKADLIKADNGVWAVKMPGELHGTYYDFTVHGPEGPGSAFHASHPVHISDPYAKVNVGALGKSRVWREDPVASHRAGGALAMENLVAYEVHVQDFTDLLPEAAQQNGPFEAFASGGLRNASGAPIGLDHLTELGVNAVHLMPVQEYLHHPDTEWRAAFGGDERLKALGVADENYQWGYRTTHALAIERRFGDRSAEPGNERQAFRNLVDAIHARGMAVIVDIVPNHTGENMDGQERLIHFNVLDKAYYYRTDDEARHIGPFGNEVKTEDRPMVRRWLIDQCLSLVNDFGVDGFRIDLAGQIDEQTLIALREAVGPNVLIYGEPWIAISDEYVRADPDLSWYKEDAPISFFQDDARNAFKGSPFELSDKQRDRGYAGGNVDQRADVMAALANAYTEEAASPNLGVNYLDIHDNWALADRFATEGWNGLDGVDEARYRIAAGLLLTSLGPVVIHGGAEMMRSKGLAPLEEWDVETPFGDIHFKGRDDTYNLRTPNQFRWETVGTGPQDGAVADYAAMQAWWAGLIKFRLSERGAVFRLADAPPTDHYRWLLPQDKSLLGYLVGDEVLVLVNIGDEPGRFENIDLPSGDWLQIADGARIDHEAGLGAPVNADALSSVQVPGTSLSIWVRMDQ